jgi:hypothetical protein
MRWSTWESVMAKCEGMYIWVFFIYRFLASISDFLIFDYKLVGFSHRVRLPIFAELNLAHAPGFKPYTPHAWLDNCLRWM